MKRSTSCPPSVSSLEMVTGQSVNIASRDGHVGNGVTENASNDAVISCVLREPIDVESPLLDTRSCEESISTNTGEDMAAEPMGSTKATNADETHRNEPHAVSKFQFSMKHCILGAMLFVCIWRTCFMDYGEPNVYTSLSLISHVSLPMWDAVPKELGPVDDWSDQGHHFLPTSAMLQHAPSNYAPTASTSSVELAKLVCSLNNAFINLVRLLVAMGVVSWLLQSLSKWSGKLKRYPAWLLLLHLLVHEAVMQFNYLQMHGRMNISTYTTVNPTFIDESTLETNTGFVYQGPLEDTTLAQNALANFEFFHDLPPGTASIEDLHLSSAGLLGWASFNPCAHASPQGLISDSVHSGPFGEALINTDGSNSDGFHELCSETAPTDDIYSLLSGVVRCGSLCSPAGTTFNELNSNSPAHVVPDASLLDCTSSNFEFLPHCTSSGGDLHSSLAGVLACLSADRAADLSLTVCTDSDWYDPIEFHNVSDVAPPILAYEKYYGQVQMESESVEEAANSDVDLCDDYHQTHAPLESADVQSLEVSDLAHVEADSDCEMVESAPLNFLFPNTVDRASGRQPFRDPWARTRLWVNVGVPAVQLRAHTSADGRIRFKARAYSPPHHLQQFTWGCEGGTELGEVQLACGSYAVVACQGEDHYRAIMTEPARFGQAAGHAGLASREPVEFAGEIESCHASRRCRPKGIEAKEHWLLQKCPQRKKSTEIIIYKFVILFL